jgi:hypothetical protein
VIVRKADAVNRYCAGRSNIKPLVDFEREWGSEAPPAVRVEWRAEGPVLAWPVEDVDPAEVHGGGAPTGVGDLDLAFPLVLVIPECDRQVRSVAEILRHAQAGEYGREDGGVQGKQGIPH